MLPISKARIPKTKIPEGVTADDFLRQQVMAGAKRLYGDVNTEVQRRIDCELEAIRNWQVADYFLVVADYVRYLRQNCFVGPGRGSVASSIANYCLGISEVEPLANGLLFERFFRLDGAEMPDIDIDTGAVGKSVLPSYLIEQYGFKHVALIKGHAFGIVISPDDITALVPTSVIQLDCGKECLSVEASAKEIEAKGLIRFDAIPLDKLFLTESLCYEKRSQRKGKTYGIQQLDNLLAETNGAFVYQEQMMTATQFLASFTPRESDELRRALARNNGEVEHYRELFIRRGINNGNDETSLKEIFADWEQNGYMFLNKAHHVSYNLLSKQN